MKDHMSAMESPTETGRSETGMDISTQKYLKHWGYIFIFLKWWSQMTQFHSPSYQDCPKWYRIKQVTSYQNDYSDHLTSTFDSHFDQQKKNRDTYPYIYSPS